MRAYFITGYIFTSILGTFSHFFYEWSGNNPVIALFSPVNESTWEHMKLIFFPVLFYTFLFIISILKTKKMASDYSNRHTSTNSLSSDKGHKKKENRSDSALCIPLLFGNLLGTLSIPVLFYTYSGILGRHFLPIDLTVFLIGVWIVFYTAWKYKDSERLYHFRYLIVLLTILLTLSFFLFTFIHPQIGLYQNP